MDVISCQKEEEIKQPDPKKTFEVSFEPKSSIDTQQKEMKEKNKRKKAGVLMGKLHDDMMFLDKIAKHPALQKNMLILKDEENNSAPKDIDKVLKEIRGAANDGLKFLKVRKNFWETSEPPNNNSKEKRKGLKRSRSEQSSRNKTHLNSNDSHISLLVL